jgi:hypothetical protein
MGDQKSGTMNEKTMPPTGSMKGAEEGMQAP